MATENTAPVAAAPVVKGKGRKPPVVAAPAKLKTVGTLYVAPAGSGAEVKAAVAVANAGRVCVELLPDPLIKPEAVAAYYAPRMIRVTKDATPAAVKSADADNAISKVDRERLAGASQTLRAVKAIKAAAAVRAYYTSL